MNEIGKLERKEKKKNETVGHSGPANVAGKQLLLNRMLAERLILCSLPKVGPETWFRNIHMDCGNIKRTFPTPLLW